MQSAFVTFNPAGDFKKLRIYINARPKGLADTFSLSSPHPSPLPQGERELIEFANNSLEVFAIIFYGSRKTFSLREKILRNLRIVTNINLKRTAIFQRTLFCIFKNSGY